ncbi:hypothetical protein HPT27_00180 [Permianibacter sp. IMCC34836]|uniref:hypothetical protein n=1 Tax=Permianibacter fluminis TaxID=2738515 RepID=UPI001551FDFA|nr:hypothetical protein [Permianibacter fluminis]NQD35417.1 hypothetical protein [Permianibacter fluminis]
MSNPMELDDLKAAWQAMDRKLEQQNGLLLLQARESQFKTLRRRLLPLRFGQALQMLFGVALILPSVTVWSSLRDGSALFWAGIVMHVYGVMLIVTGGIMQGLLSEFDRGESVLTNQKRLAKARRFYVLAGMSVGLPWWLLWIPFMMVISAAATGVDFYARMPSAINWMLLVGVLGLVATLLLHRWAMRRPSWANRIERSAAGRSLNRAKATLDEIAAFEQD